MKPQKTLLVIISLIMSTILLTSIAYAGFSIRLEKDVPSTAVSEWPNEITFNIYDSEDVTEPVASQTFFWGEWSADFGIWRFDPNFSDRPQRIVRFKADFTNTDALTKDMELWVEIELDEVVIEERERVKFFINQEDKRNLEVKWVSGAHVDINVERLMVENVALTNIDLTADITQSGPNGLDTGTEEPDTWYSIWVICGSAGTASLLSISPNSPTMPSGYTKNRRVGWVYNDSSSEFRKFYHRGDWWFYDVEHMVREDSVEEDGVWTDLSLNAFIPPAAKKVMLWYRLGADPRYHYLWLREKGTNWERSISGIQGGWGGGVVYWRGQIEIPVSNQTIQFKTDGGYTEYPHLEIYVKGYYDPI